MSLTNEFRCQSSSPSSSDLFHNGSLFIRPFQDYMKSIHAGLFLCQATNAAGSIQSLPIQLKPRNDRWKKINRLKFDIFSSSRDL